MKILEFPIKSPLCHCEELASGDEAISVNALTEIASLRPLLEAGFAHNDNAIILALGAESAGNFSVFHRRQIYFSKDFGDLLEENNFQRFKKAVLEFLRKNRIKPDVILTDLHPLYKTTLWGAELAKKSASGGKAKHIQVQHHIAHLFSSTGEKIMISKFQIPNSFFGIALDGTGYGLDGKIWGGEIFECQMSNVKCQVKRIGHLENQIMIGGDLAVKEPARMLIAILAKIQNAPLTRGARGVENGNSNLQTPFLPKADPLQAEIPLVGVANKNFIYNFVKKYYTRNQFELLYNQLQQNFNCQETSSTGRVLDAVSILLGFCGNKRNYKHEPIDLLEKNSAKPHDNLKPKIIETYNEELGIMNYELSTTYLFEYLIRNLHKDKKRLAATTQLYIAQGMYEIIKKIHDSRFRIHDSYLAGGIANNKIISSYFESKGFYANKKFPRGDAGISLGQIIYYLHSGA